jgi:hypothetical protein
MNSLLQEGVFWGSFELEIINELKIPSEIYKNFNKMHIMFMASNRYIPSSTKNRVGFLLKYKVAKRDVKGKGDSTVIGPESLG